VDLVSVARWFCFGVAWPARSGREADDATLAGELSGAARSAAMKLGLALHLGFVRKSPEVEAPIELEGHLGPPYPVGFQFQRAAAREWFARQVRSAVEAATGRHGGTPRRSRKRGQRARSPGTPMTKAFSPPMPAGTWSPFVCQQRSAELPISRLAEPVPVDEPANHCSPGGADRGIIVR
jgi:hypothetical protein